MRPGITAGDERAKEGCGSVSASLTVVGVLFLSEAGSLLESEGPNIVHLSVEYNRAAKPVPEAEVGATTAGSVEVVAN